MISQIRINRDVIKTVINIFLRQGGIQRKFIIATAEDKEGYCKEPVNFFYKDVYTTTSHGVRFKLKAQQKTKKASNIVKEYSRELIVIAKNSVKQRIHEATVKVKQICENLKTRINNEHFALIDCTAENSKEKEFTKKKNHLINKFEKLKNSTGKKG